MALATRTGLIAALLLTLGACTPRGEAAAQRNTDDVAKEALLREMTRIRERVESIDAIFHPLPLLRPAQEAALRRFDNDAQLSAARRLGISPATPESGLRPLVSERRLTRLADSTDYWLVRKLDSSSPYLTPDAAAALREISERFQRALARLGAPPFRVEVTSALRSSEDQAALRRTNVNAAAGESTHQFGTSFDLAYNGFGAPAAGVITPRIPEAPWLGPHLAWTASALTEAVAARRSRELMAVLGNVLTEMQTEGKIMVTLERLQPVYHVTVAKRY